MTLQPIRRFGFDAAILFSDILVVPHALGQTVRFEAGEGPRLEPLDDPAAIRALRGEVDHDGAGAGLRDDSRWSKRSCRRRSTLLGFCGAPWTVATYMIAGRGTPDQAPARLFAYRDPEAFARLIDVLVEASVDYLIGSSQAGVDAVQIFDTWAGVLPPDEFERWCIAPTQRIVAEVRARGAGREDHRVSARRRHAICRAMSRRSASMRSGSTGWWICDFARDADPEPACRCRAISIRWRCVAGGAALDRAIDAILEAFAGGPFIFNLGHGILPETPIAHVEQMLKRVRGRECGAALRLRSHRAAMRRAGCRPLYEWLKAFHIIAVIAWMAGMLYLPRLFVYHCDGRAGSTQSETFKVMERRLLGRSSTRR